MADGGPGGKVFRDAALVLAEDAAGMAGRLNKYIRSGQYEKAEAVANGLQRTARDTKWLMQRQPKE